MNTINLTNYFSLPDFILLILIFPAVLKLKRVVSPREITIIGLDVFFKLLFIFLLPFPQIQQFVLQKDVLAFLERATLMSHGAYDHLTLFAINTPDIYILFLSCCLRLHLTVMGILELTIITYLLTCYIFLKIMIELNLRKYFILLIILYSFIPHIFYVTTSLLREPWELLLFSLGIYFVLLFLNPNGKWRYLMYAVSMFLSAGLLHGGICIAGIAIIFMAFLFKRSSLSLGLAILGCLTLVMILILTISPSLLLKLLNIANLSVKNYQLANTSYPVLMVEDLLSFMLNTVTMLFYYLFYPFPWAVSNLNDLYASCIGILNFIALILNALFILGRPRNARKKACFFLLAFLIISLVFSMGTTNYGTALRHNVLSIWIIYMLASAYIYNFFSLKIKEKIPLNHRKEINLKESI